VQNNSYDKNDIIIILWVADLDYADKNNLFLQYIIYYDFMMKQIYDEYHFDHKKINKQINIWTTIRFNFA